ncbi:hypothetical protein B0J13DRAFT_596686 [Dactylonectria estremocensis]|uniref:Rhodopsin domain-containing protein n=1 Tax=Dactylonectria estremocensis TaxID=1079267 RepID=A0A9P9ELD4_9HYPO|nr:hypothetical protein B0J13DRAFT_596686 [Dactylonectria estremocensis]
MSSSDAANSVPKAIADAIRRSAVESWTLYSIGVASTLLRTYARMRGRGFPGLSTEDYLVLAYCVGNRSTLSPEDHEYNSRWVYPIAGWTIYSSLIWSLKLSMLFFYTRLTDSVDQRYRIRIQIGFALVVATFVACILTVFLACRPFHKYWQINPDPGNSCQAAISKPIIWVSFAANVPTDIYLIGIPIPMLWQSGLKTIKKIAYTVVLGTGIFVLVCPTLKSIFVLVDPVNGAALAGAWGTREAFVAVITTNLPLLFPLLRAWFTPLFGSMLRSSQKAYQTPSGFRTIGGGGDGESRRNRGPPTAKPITANMTLNDSEERIVDDVEMQPLKISSTSVSADYPSNGIVVSNEVEVTHEDRSSQHSEHAQRVREIWQPGAIE